MQRAVLAYLSPYCDAAAYWIIVALLRSYIIFPRARSTVAVISAGVSLLLLILFWYPWLIVGVLIDIGILIALVWAKWQSVELIGS
ncbi:MAG: hypothetical protein IMY85_01190 [Chloroflexi bacterium]|nr:hypothetical protein [Chloroflexota bacterium]